MLLWRIAYMFERQARKGFLGIIVLILFVGGIIGLYFGYNWFNQRYYIALYDGQMTRYLDIPPFAERKTHADLELIGECTLSIGTSEKQARDFLNSMSDRLGYMCNDKDGKMIIEVRRNYIITGEFGGGLLKLNWTPVLPETLKKKAAKIAKEVSEN